MNFADRFRFQIFFPLILFSAVSLKRKYQLLIIPLFLICFWPMYADTNYFSWLKYYGPVLNRAYKDLGLRLARFKDKNYTLMLGDAGAIPYFSEWKCYDFVGLADKEIARRGVTRQYLEKTSPDLVCLYSLTPDEKGILKDFSQEIILNYIKDHPEYEAAGKIRPYDYYLIFFMKRTAPDFNAVRQEVQERDKVLSRLRIDFKDLLLQKYLF